MNEQVDNLNEILKKETPEPIAFLKSKAFLAVFALVIVAGTITGYLLSKAGGGKEGTIINSNSGVVSQESIKTGSEFGSKNQTFKDTTLGTLEKGGVDGEGTHKLLREGGPSQTAYLTSSTLDLDQFVGKKVQVWGETFKAQKAGWLMDVGRLKILE